jgi:hypothetical protein
MPYKTLGDFLQTGDSESVLYRWFRDSIGEGGRYKVIKVNNGVLKVKRHDRFFSRDLECDLNTDNHLGDEVYSFLGNVYLFSKRLLKRLFNSTS